MELTDFFSRANADYIEQLYRQYRDNPSSIDERWAVFFTGFEAGGGGGASVLEALLSTKSGSPAEGIQHLVHSYRELGHLQGRINPLDENKPEHPLLNLKNFGFTEADLAGSSVNAGFKGPYDGTLGGLIQSLKAAYCGTLGVEFAGISDKEQLDWLYSRLEPDLGQPSLSLEEKKTILFQLCQAEGFENFLHTKYVGQKRFSVQGAESVIPLLDTLIENGGGLGAEDFLIGMAHRGRLNVLAHVLQKPYQMILREFEGNTFPREDGVDGDVKYHLGYERERVLRGGTSAQIALSPNPSHLELVNPVVEGMVAAKQFLRGGGADSHTQVVPILVHGEAAFTGQGIVPETISLSELRAYQTGGTIHIIINNQVGFTANPWETRSTRYPTDVARMTQTPVFHVNADDPEAVVEAARLAMSFRQTFKKDVLIDLWGYRKYGHNESDDPTFTQPVMYRTIEKMKSARDKYAERLISEGVLDEAEFESLKAQVKGDLDAAFEAAHSGVLPEKPNPLSGLWQGMTKAKGAAWDVETAISPETLSVLSERLTTTPDDFKTHPKLKKLLATRAEMGRGDKNLDWAAAEMFAFGSLLLEGHPIRLAGQDCERGTFSHRHAVLSDFETGAKFTALSALHPEQASITIVNTMLSELAVLGFEYGYSMTDPRNLVVWEAQFGDFVNGAQAILDQFISSAESKWERMSGIVLLLPHGYEGQGPEHSSARLERFLQLSADGNWQVCYPSQPAQYFHLLRRQMKRSFRKPLVLMMPKSLLRDEKAASPLAELSAGKFHPVLVDPAVDAPKKVTRVVFCTGKVYFTLAGARQAAKPEVETALVRVEQLYPFPEEAVKAALAIYPGAKEFFWCQEEPKNMGAWFFVAPRLQELLPAGKHLHYRGRKEAASPANGSYKVHGEEEKAFIRETFAASTH